MALDQFVTLRERGEWFEGRMNDFESGPRCHARGKWWNSADEGKISLGILDQHRRFSFLFWSPGEDRRRAPRSKMFAPSRSRPSSDNLVMAVFVDETGAATAEPRGKVKRDSANWRAPPRQLTILHN